MNYLAAHFKVSSQRDDRLLKQLVEITKDFTMISRITSLLSLLILFLSTAEVCAEENVDPVERVAAQVATLNFDSISESRAVYHLISLAKSCDKLQRTDLSGRFFAQASEISSRNEKRAYHFSLFNYADQKDDLKLAESIVENALQSRTSMLDRLDLMKYRLGDKEALASYPRQKLTFYNAMDLAQTYIELGEYEKAEKYVTGIKISEENDPLSVTGLILNEIAERYQAEGNEALAKKYIDKAFTLAGNLFYTGYCIEIDHRSMHGELTIDVEDFAERGQRHRGHMGRELVGNLIRELIDTKEFQAAKQAIQYLEEEKYQQQYLGRIAVAMAKDGQPGEAFQAINEMTDQSAQTFAQIELAATLWSLGEKESSSNLLRFTEAKLDGNSFSEFESHYQVLIKRYSQIGNQEKIESILKLAKEDLQRLRLIDKSLQGYVIGFTNQDKKPEK